MEIYKIINVPSATFDQFNVSLLNKNFNLFYKNINDPKLLNRVY